MPRVAALFALARDDHRWRELEDQQEEVVLLDVDADVKEVEDLVAWLV